MCLSVWRQIFPKSTVKMQCSIMFIFSSCFSAGSLLIDIGNGGRETKHGRWMRVAKHLFLGIYRGGRTFRICWLTVRLPRALQLKELGLMLCDFKGWNSSPVTPAGDTLKQEGLYFCGASLLWFSVGSLGTAPYSHWTVQHCTEKPPRSWLPSTRKALWAFAIWSNYSDFHSPVYTSG